MHTTNMYKLHFIIKFKHTQWQSLYQTREMAVTVSNTYYNFLMRIIHC